MTVPVVSGRRAVKAFRKIDYKVDRRVGSHIILRQGRAPYRLLTVTFRRETAKDSS